VLSKIKNYFKHNLETRRYQQEWIQAKVDFARAQKLMLERRSVYSALQAKDDAPKGAKSTDAYNWLDFFPDICFVHGPLQPNGIILDPILAERKRKKAQAACLAAKRKMILAAFDVVKKEIEAAKEYEILTTLHLSQNSMDCKEAMKEISSKKAALKAALEEFESRVKEARDSVKVNTEEAELLERNLTDFERENKKSRGQVRAISKRLDVEVARLSPQVARCKVMLAECTALLFGAVVAFDQLTSAHSRLMIDKSEARVRSRLAKNRVTQVGLTCSAGTEEALLSLALDEGDTAELNAVREPTVAELQAEISRLSRAAGSDMRVAELRHNLKALETKREKAEFRSADLDAEVQISRARVECESAEGALWEEWLMVAAAEGNSKPTQRPGSSILAKAAQVDAATLLLRLAVVEAKKAVGEQKRRLLPAYCGEEPNSKALASAPWVPSKEVGDFAQCELRLNPPALRALVFAQKALEQGAALVAPLRDQCKEEIAQLDRRLEDVVKLSAHFRVEPLKAPSRKAKG
jgi:predicted nuclease with TOPRIM domain